MVVNIEYKTVRLLLLDVNFIHKGFLWLLSPFKQRNNFAQDFICSKIKNVLTKSIFCVIACLIKEREIFVLSKHAIQGMLFIEKLLLVWLAFIQSFLNCWNYVLLRSKHELDLHFQCVGLNYQRLNYFMCIYKPLLYKPTINNSNIICFCKIFVIINHEYLYFSPSLIKRKFNAKCMLSIYYYFKAFNLFIFLFSYFLCIDPEIPFQNIYHVVHK